MSSWADKFNWLVSVLPDALKKSGAGVGLSGTGTSGHYAKWTGASTLGDGGAIPADSCAITQSLTPPSAVNLTTEGALDWMFFNGLSAISQPPLQNSIPLKRNGWGMGLTYRWLNGGLPVANTGTVAATAVSFTDCATLASATGLTSQRGVSYATAGSAGFGYTFQVPAVGASRTLRIYGAITSGTGTLSVVLPGGAIFTDTLSAAVGTMQPFFWEIVYSSGLAGLARVSVTQTTNLGSGVCSFMAATLATS